MARKRHQPIATFQTRKQPVRVYAPTASYRGPHDLVIQ
jgi:hypothetical protein